jgi:hypothetical protein
MARIERMRETLWGPLTAEHLEDRAAQGWRPVAVEWEREAEGSAAAEAHEVPYGLRVSRDCLHLETHPEEMRAMRLAMEVIVDDGTLSQAAEAMNRAGLRTRAGSAWTQTAVFNLLPRLIEMGPKIFSTEEWMARRGRLVGA